MLDPFCSTSSVLIFHIGTSEGNVKCKNLVIYSVAAPGYSSWDGASNWGLWSNVQGHDQKPNEK